jgi:hypothetical protein
MKGPLTVRWRPKARRTALSVQRNRAGTQATLSNSRCVDEEEVFAMYRLLALATRGRVRRSSPQSVEVPPFETR